jgi:hypothetical protein
MNIDKKALAGFIKEVEDSRTRLRAAQAAERSAFVEAEVAGFSRLQILVEIVKARAARRLASNDAPKSWVYFAKAEGLDLVKIGYSITPAARMDSLRVALKQEFRLLGTIEGDDFEEEVIHAFLNFHRAWYSRLPEVFVYSRIKGSIERMIAEKAAITERPQ